MDSYTGIPGPWMVIEDDRADVIRIVETLEYTPGFYTEICEIGQGLPEAHLIAAAPDLLKALIMAEANLRALATERWGENWIVANQYEPIYKAQSAISKAMGEEVSGE